MKFPILLLAATLLPLTVFGQKKEVVELQRDIALLQDQVRTLQRSQDEKLAALTVLVQQALDAANKANTSVAVLQSGLNERLGEQNKTVGGTVAGLGVKVDQMSDQFTSLREAIADLSSRMGKLDLKLADIGTAVRTIGSTPAPPPPADNTTPGSTTAPPGGGMAAAQPMGPAPSAEATYTNAQRDLSGGNLDLALAEFQEYLKFYRDTDLAPNAQYHIGEILYRQQKYDEAISAFDLVLEKFSDNNKTPDAHYMKAQALFKNNKKTAASREYCEVVKKFPKNPLAAKSKSALQGMGYSGTCGVASAAPTSSKRKRKS